MYHYVSMYLRLSSKTFIISVKTKQFSVAMFVDPTFIQIIFLTPCIMCVHYRGGYHEKCGGYLEYLGAQYCGHYHDACGDIMSNVGVFSTMGDIIF